MSNVLLIVVLIFAKFIDRSRTSDLFLFKVLRKSLLNAIFKKNMPKHSILILVVYFGESRYHQKYRIINRIFIQDLHKQPSK